ncbi:hypothetical protein [Actinomadura litoris]|uniref:hypothetical protein n=1 Tax=Actinomadura litoris TaxID=2678616 RepID=UPI001FA7EFFC|nr:hypothetical protein [Actinomadura litoris]
MTKLTALPIGPYPLETRAAEVRVMLDDLYESLTANRKTRRWAEDVVRKAADQAKDLHARIYAHWLTGEESTPELVMEFIGTAMAAEVEARNALSIDPREMLPPERWVRQLIAACWAAALNWGVPVEYQR